MFTNRSMRNSKIAIHYDPAQKCLNYALNLDSLVLHNPHLSGHGQPVLGSTIWQHEIFLELDQDAVAVGVYRLNLEMLKMHLCTFVESHPLAEISIFTNVPIPSDTRTLASRWGVSSSSSIEFLEEICIKPGAISVIQDIAEDIVGLLEQVAAHVVTSEDNMYLQRMGYQQAARLERANAKMARLAVQDVSDYTTRTVIISGRPYVDNHPRLKDLVSFVGLLAVPGVVNKAVAAVMGLLYRRNQAQEIESLRPRVWAKALCGRLPTAVMVTDQQYVDLWKNACLTVANTSVISCFAACREEVLKYNPWMNFNHLYYHYIISGQTSCDSHPLKSLLDRPLKRKEFLQLLERGWLRMEHESIHPDSKQKIITRVFSPLVKEVHEANVLALLHEAPWIREEVPEVLRDLVPSSIMDSWRKRLLGVKIEPAQPHCEEWFLVPLASINPVASLALSRPAPETWLALQASFSVGAEMEALSVRLDVGDSSEEEPLDGRENAMSRSCLPGMSTIEELD